MSERQIFMLSHAQARRNAADACLSAPDGWRVELKPRTRSLDQNALMWSVLTDISRQVPFNVNGVSTLVSPDDVKDILSASLAGEMRQAQLECGRVVLLGQRTSKMTVGQMSDLITLGHQFGDAHDVRWSKTSLGAA